MADYNEDGVDRLLDPRSYEAARQYHAVRQAEQIIYRAEHGPDPMARFTTSLFAQLRQASATETNNEEG